jgi:hypothetical protein
MQANNRVTFTNLDGKQLTVHLGIIVSIAAGVFIGASALKIPFQTRSQELMFVGGCALGSIGLYDIVSRALTHALPSQKHL